MGKNNNKNVKVVHGGQESSEEEGPIRFKPLTKKPIVVKKKEEGSSDSDEEHDPTKIKKSDVTNEERMINLARLEEVKRKREMAAR